MNEAALKKDTVLIVDDTPDNISLLSSLLKERYKIKIATSGAKALQIAAAAPQPDLVLLDVMMPEMDGYECCRRLKADPQTAAIPVIFLTAKNQAQDEETGLKLGAADYIGKPISPPIVLARVATQLHLKAARQLLADQNGHVESLVRERTARLDKLLDAIILAMAGLAETRDSEAAGHARRTQHYVLTLAHQLRAQPRFAALLTDENIDQIKKAVPLHDIGMARVPDLILYKPDKLTTEEIAAIKRHAVAGRDIIIGLETQVASSDGFLGYAREIAYSHQEKWDGSGYPLGLQGTAIPLSARLMAVADVYDALVSRRVYRPAYTHEEAMVIMREGRGKHFDPDILDALLATEERFRAISLLHRDGEGGAGHEP